MFHEGLRGPAFLLMLQMELILVHTVTDQVCAMVPWSLWKKPNLKYESFKILVSFTRCWIMVKVKAFDDSCTFGINRGLVLEFLRISNNDSQEKQKVAVKGEMNHAANEASFCYQSMSP